MKKVKFVSGFNAKLALVACAVAGFSLTGCEKEEFSVDVPNISVDVPNIEWPETQDGIAYVLLSANSSTGEALNGVTFSIDGEVQSAIFVAVTAGEHTITAEKAGYSSNSVNVVIPTLPQDAVLNIPVNIVLTAINVDENNNISAVPDMSESEEAPEVPATELAVSAPAGGFQAGEVRVENVPVPTAEPFLTAEQKAQFYSAVDAYLEGLAETRALTGNLAAVRDLFYAKIASYGETANTQPRDYTFNIDKAASNILLSVSTTYLWVNLTINVVYENQSYSVTNQCTVAGATVVSATADGVDVGHGHGHGDDGNAGGGTTGTM